MTRLGRWAPSLALAGLLALAAPALAQTNDDPLDGFENEGSLFGNGLGGSSSFGGDSGGLSGGSSGLADTGCIDETSGSASEGSIASFGDVSADATTERTVESDVSLDEDDVLLAIALSNNGANGIRAEDIGQRESLREETTLLRQDVQLDRDDAFNALALGETASDADSLDCLGDLRVERTIATSTQSDVSLDEDDVLLAIALGNNLGGGGSTTLSSVGDISGSQSTSVTFEREFDLDREDVFSALLFGSGN